MQEFDVTYPSRLEVRVLVKKAFERTTNVFVICWPIQGLWFCAQSSSLVCIKEVWYTYSIAIIELMQSLYNS